MIRLALLALCVASCSTDDDALPSPTSRWVAPKDTGPRGSAPTAKHRVLASYPDGTRDHVVILATGDEVMTALADLAKREAITAARFSAIGAVSEGEVAFFDFSRKQYKGMKLVEQLEMVSLVGDIALDKDGKPTVHAHAVLGRADGSTLGGHLLGAIAKPTLEVFVTTYPQTLQKRLLPESDTQVIVP
jgi:predicted DNA-binding protein with PD1-like motif